MVEHSPWAPRRSASEQRKKGAELLYELEMECRRQGWGADPALVYDEEKDIFRFLE